MYIHFNSLITKLKNKEINLVVLKDIPGQTTSSSAFQADPTELYTKHSYSMTKAK